MGFFSWKTSDTNKSIPNMYSEAVRTVYVLLPEGGHIQEDNYDGYGTFGGQDIYALLARWNAPEKCVGFDEEDRDIGIEIAYGKIESSEKARNIKFPIKIVDEPVPYEDAKPSKDCDSQGHFYSNREIHDLKKHRSLMTKL